MNRKHLKSNTFRAVALAAGLLVSLPQLCHAQGAAVTPAGGGRLYVELRDASLADALEMIFKASGNPSHIIDESAKYTMIPFQPWENKEWDEIIRVLANLYNFKFYRDTQSGTYIIEPRVVPQPVAPQFGGDQPSPFAGGGSPFGRPVTGGPGPASNVPRNPFQAQGGATTGGNQPVAPTGPASRQTNVFGRPQTLPSLGRPMGAGAPTARPDEDAPSPFGPAPTPPVPASPFSSVVPTTPRPGGSAGMAPTRPGGTGAGGTGTGGTSRTGKNGEPKEYHILTVKHIYAGAVTKVFANGTILPTEDLVNMGSDSGGGGGGGFGGGNNRNGGNNGNNRGNRGGRSGFGGISGGSSRGGFGGGGSNFGSSNRFGSLSSEGSRLARAGDLDVYGLGF
jgi:hypothetical protein